jgi:hypothetical protein
MAAAVDVSGAALRDLLLAGGGAEDEEGELVLRVAMVILLW